MKIITLIVFLLIPIFGDSKDKSQNSTLINLSFETDKNGDISPKIFYPIYWNDNLFSGFGYSSSKNIENSRIDKFQDSRESEFINQQNLRINFLSKQYKKDNFQFSLGFIGEYIKIDKTQFGFIHDKNGIFEQGDIWVSFDNGLEIEVLKYGIYFDISTSLKEKIFFRFSTNVTPTADISINQNTRFKPLVSENGEFSENANQDISYSLLFEILLKTDLGLSFGAEYEYDFFPLEYNLATLSKDGDSFFFQTTKVQSETVTSSWLLKLVFDKKILGDMNPSFGFGKKRIEVKDIFTNSRKVQNENIIRFGIEKRF